MMSWLSFPFVCLGHLAVGSAIYNQTHASILRRSFRKIIERLIILVVLGGFGFFLYRRLIGHDFSYESLLSMPVLFGYEIGCLAVAAGVTGRWIFRQFDRADSSLIEHHVNIHQVPDSSDAPVLLSWDAKLLGKIPFNQSTQIRVETKKIVVSRLPTPLDGLVISHLSDLHLTGKVSRRYFDELVRLSNQQAPDLVCITGDIIDFDHCLDWLDPVIGNLQARFGVFFVFGNHDKRISDVPALQQKLEALGAYRLDSDWRTCEAHGCQIKMAGNELPWFPGAQSLPSLATDRMQNEFRMMLSHSPDQLEFARKQNVDLLLAGHTHGGQIRFPILGPIVAPSRFGVKYATGNGIFREGETLMHVSRGISGDDVIRINCAPELAILKLCQRSAKMADHSAAIDEGS